MSPIPDPRAQGPSLWLDGALRDLLESGELARLVAASEVRGSLFHTPDLARAIAETGLYTGSLRPLVQADWTAERVIEALKVDDARTAADLILPLFERTEGVDGFVSIEVSPESARDPARLSAEIKRLWSAVNRPNLIVQIPATPAALPTVEQAIAEGINVLAGPVFSLERHAEVIEAYLRGLEARLSRGASLNHVASVAAFSLSALEAKVEGLLQEVARQGGAMAERAAALSGKSGLATAKLAYAQFNAAFGGDRFLALAPHGARVQSLLWTLEIGQVLPPSEAGDVGPLIGPGTILAVPSATLALIRDHAQSEPSLERDLSAARAQLDALLNLGIALPTVTALLETEGTARIDEAHRLLTESIRRHARTFQQELGPLRPAIGEALARLEKAGFARRLWLADASLWTDDPDQAEEVRQRLGWLTLPQESEGLVEGLEAFASELRSSGFTQAVLLGMGGSSLAPDVFCRTLASPDSGLTFHVLDTTDPAAVLALTRLASIESTLFIVASKSGTTTEPLALMEHFWAEACGQVGEAAAGSHFVAITDIGTPLEGLARERGFRRVFSSPSQVGGRYSALSVFGLLPAALMGVDIHALLRGGSRMAHACAPAVEPVRSAGLFLGGVLGAAALQGRDKLTFVSDPGLAPLEDWIEQLIAESSGKEGKGILPVVGEAPAAPAAYGRDRLLVYLRRDGSHDRRLAAWSRAGVPVAVVEVGQGAEGFGGEFFRWEVATATACHLMGVNAFDQPDVQRAKTRTVELLKVYRRKGSLPRPETLWEGDGIALWGGQSRECPAEPGGAEGLLPWLLTRVRPGEALAFLLYLDPTPALERAMTRLRRTLRDKKDIPTTLGLGPRYLHSTGQLHKGGPDRMVFLIVTADPKVDLPVPGASHTFGILERAQAIGDLQALLALGRRAYGLHFDRLDRFRELAARFASALGASARHE